MPPISLRAEPTSMDMPSGDVMGDADKADPAAIPDFSCHTDNSLACVGGVIEMKANYQLITDNLLDLAEPATPALKRRV